LEIIVLSVLSEIRGRVTNDNSYQLAPNNFSNGLPQLKEKKRGKSKAHNASDRGVFGEI
jgi:hypothetical protein